MGPEQDIGVCTGWQAWYNAEPPAHPGTLNVTATCTFKSDGHLCELIPAESQGINPKIYVLQRVVRDSPGAATTARLQFSRRMQEYDQIQIIPDNITLDVKVIH